MAPPTILLTRPSGQSQRFADLLRERIGAGARIVIAPVLRITMRPLSAETLAAPGVVFTSQNGVRAFVEAGGAGRGRPAWCVGARTAEAAEAAGFAAVSAGGDGNALVTRLTDARPQMPVWYVHGAHVTGDVAAQLRAAGLTVASVIGYDQHATGLTADARACLAGSGRVIAPVFSPRSAWLLAPELASATAPVALAALSPAVATALAAAGPRPLRVAATPDAAAMLTLLADMIDERRT